jgi:chromosome segregation ATPase
MDKDFTIEVYREKLKVQEQELNKLRADVKLYKKMVEEENSQKYEAYKRIHELQSELRKLNETTGN